MPSRTDAPISEEIRRRVLSEAAAAGNIIILNQLPGVAPQEEIKRGAELLLKVATGEEALRSIPKGLSQVLSGVELLLSVVPDLAPQPKGSFKPQRRGLTRASRNVLLGKREHAANFANVDMNPTEMESTVEQTEVLQGTISALEGSFGRIQDKAAPLEYRLYQMNKHAYDIMWPTFDKNPRLGAQFVDLTDYMMGRYDKGVQTRQTNLLRDEATREKFTEAMEKKDAEATREKLAEELATAFVRRLRDERPADRRGPDRDDG